MGCDPTELAAELELLLELTELEGVLEIEELLLEIELDVLLELTALDVALELEELLLELTVPAGESPPQPAVSNAKHEMPNTCLIILHPNG